MSLCINPDCKQTKASSNDMDCMGCGSKLLLSHKYRVTRLMSDKGGCGNIYEISHPDSLGPKVLKVLKNNDEKVIELFKREYEVLDKLKGVKGIPVVEEKFEYSYNGSSKPLHCLVMELISGEDLEKYLSRKNQQPIDEKTALLWLGKLTEILGNIHRKGIFHRDIKPSNIMIEPDGKLVLIDFGAVKQAAHNPSQQGTRVISNGYSAPEQERLGTASIQSDFFSLGRTFVYLLTKEHPVNLLDGSSNQCVWRHLNSSISTGLFDLIEKLMQLNPTDRPANSEVILAEIRSLSTNGQTTGTTIIPPGNGKNNGSGSKVQTIISGIGVVSFLKSVPRPILLLSGIIPLFIFAACIAVAVRPKNLEFKDVGNDAPIGTFNSGGSSTWATTRQENVKLDSVIHDALPQFIIRYIDNNSPSKKIASIYKNKCPIGPGSVAGICWLIEGDLDFAQSSMPLKQYDYTNKEFKKNLKEEAVAYDAVVVVVNPKVNISALSKEQLEKIYIGDIKNWKEVGGEDLPIYPLFRNPSSGTGFSFREFIDVPEKNIKAELVQTPSEGLQQVLKHPGAIFYGSAKEMIVDSCGTKPIAIGKTQGSAIKPYQEPLQSFEACNNKGHKNKINFEVIKNQTYLFTRKIYVVIKADGSDRQKAGEAYAKLLKTKQGQELLERAGFVRIAD
jgi:serine/threonine protein kinase